ncbi:hypothetical protein K388_07334 [Streptomyces sp. KhCrAH-43]|uniref:hypothetical protein n=1 Tax=unclassified Streptomyces TaxID=2593676 RepID=UPI00037E956D|nr:MULTISPECIES: hypothetical protein [unclassified Streptomyces]MYS33451.1 hypothetical protein [Streptomyces sp. SID4920]MYX63694.1 hypothetical protein [Streptomyces sp. SID8373]RAJ45318.1 hypothetical protein K388_07334 [Streptomyces sp. KhCrAH-43]
MTNATVTVEEIPFTPAPAPEVITPGRRVRLVGISPACLNGLTGTTQANPASRATTRLDVLLDESSTEFLRRDHRVHNTRKVKVPAPDVTQQLLTGVPTDCMFYAENDN